MLPITLISSGRLEKLSEFGSCSVVQCCNLPFAPSFGADAGFGHVAQSCFVAQVLRPVENSTRESVMAAWQQLHFGSLTP